jgi:hypothetical protein
MAIPFGAITAAIAARFDPANVVPPAGLDNIQSSNAYGAAAGSQFPLVIVNPPDEGAMTFGGQERAAVHTWTVDFYADNAMDPARIAAAIDAWLPVLVDQLLPASQLAGLVALAWVARYTTGQIELGGETYNGITLYVAVTTTDGISPVS